MKFSLITPSNNFKYLTELYQSILAQTYSNWEWIIYVNGNAFDKNIPIDIINNPKVLVIRDKTLNKNIGYLKHNAFYFASGDILVELDHDDLLVNTCLEELNITFETHPDVGFVYSDNAKMEIDKKFQPYSAKYGWKPPYYLNYKTKKYPVMNSFDADSGSMSFIWFEPDHVRAWRASIYKKIGGHNEELPFLDDQDILCRTYLVTKFYHINKPLYIYRWGTNNTCYSSDVNQKIQTQTVKIGYKYMQALAERDADLNNKLKIDIGGGIDGKSGYLTLDLHDANVICNLDDGIPLKDNSVGVINASHIIEHLHDRLKTMSEIYRVLCDGGWAFIEVPSTDGRGAFQDPTHTSYWNQNSFLYYTKESQGRYIKFQELKYGKDIIRFQAFRLETIYPSQWWKDNDIPVVYAWLRAIKSDKRRAYTINI